MAEHPPPLEMLADGTDAPQVVAPGSHATGGIDVFGVPKQCLNGRFRALAQVIDIKPTFIKIGNAEVLCWYDQVCHVWRFGRDTHLGSQVSWMHSVDKGAATPCDCKQWVCRDDDDSTCSEAPLVCIRSSRSDTAKLRGVGKAVVLCGGNGNASVGGGGKSSVSNSSDSSAGHTCYEVQHKWQSRRPEDMVSFESRKERLSRKLETAEHQRNELERRHDILLQAAKEHQADATRKASSAVVGGF
jgi:hypothetical protein